MREADFLFAVAEVGIALAGFATIVVAFTQRFSGLVATVASSPSKGRFLPGGTLVVRNADIGGGENAASFAYPPLAPKMAELVRRSEAGSIDSLFGSSSSLFAWKNSLFESVGNSFPTDWLCTGISAKPASEMPRTGEFPCTFLAKQGITGRDEFGLDSPHRH